ncbi:hypothetical protein [Bradyrhizobium iriomotense]|uniref:hypothetical protein n=1 Tax=Bradyrhizobium iriomotense TaxID=441950 RepID=UPI0024E08A63|nr:hypothetical protein [Bradyrhizobium iriomotense]
MPSITPPRKALSEDVDWSRTSWPGAFSVASSANLLWIEFIVNARHPLPSYPQSADCDQCSAFAAKIIPTS